ncbi:unnamed protein product, partial [marine sediment metagenome]
DTMGTLIGVSARAGFLDENGNLPEIKKPMLADALATMFGALVGTTTAGTFIESAAGIECQEYDCRFKLKMSGFPNFVVVELARLSFLQSIMPKADPPQAETLPLQIVSFIEMISLATPLLTLLFIKF